MFLMNNSLLKSRQHDARYFSKPARTNFACSEKLSAGSKAFGAR
jgi:hypothetical protein